MTTTTSVWIQLYYEKGEPVGRATRVKVDDNAIIDDLAEAVKEKFADDLTGVSAPRLMVYSTGTAVPVPIGTEALDPGDNMTSLTTSKTPLIVVAPDDSDFRVPAKKRRMEDLLVYHKAVLETGTSKSSKLLKVRKTSDDSKHCFLCGTSGTALDKIEASHILQKQDIYSTGGEDALNTFDILKNWMNGLGWNRPFKIHDPMNLIWLCHTHNLAFDSHHFGLTLKGLNNNVGFCSYDCKYDDLVNSANQRLQDDNEPFYDMSYVSRRAVGMRLFKAQEAGRCLNHDDTGAWETVVRLSAAASVDHHAVEGT